MEPIFESKIIGQDLSQIERAVRRAKVGLSLRNQPYGAFLLAGPTGVGKTETVHALADYLHGNANQVLTIHCAEYQHSHEIARLIGAPPGYLGHDTARPVLSQQALNQVTSMQSNVRLVLFDEIEKADPALFQLTLGILDNGVLLS